MITRVSGALAGDSAAIGYFNQVAAPRGWAIGDTTFVSGDGGVAIGTGVWATIAKSTALGRYNGPMASNDVLVVGTGGDHGARFTALRVTSNSDVILGKAQGDISMGQYQ